MVLRLLSLIYFDAILTRSATLQAILCAARLVASTQVQAQQGLIAAAEGGTLFLGEILPLGEVRARQVVQACESTH